MPKEALCKPDQDKAMRNCARCCRERRPPEKSSLPGRYSDGEDIAIGLAGVSRDNLIDLLSGGRRMKKIQIV
jgi:hypothetical protein